MSDAKPVRCETCEAWKRIGHQWGVCELDDSETRDDDYCTCYLAHTPETPNG